MPRWSFALLPLAPLALAPTVASPGGKASPFVHVQTDRPAYRIGEAIWFRAHALGAGPLDVRLLDPAGTEVGRWTGSPDADAAPGGALAIPRRLPGGVFRLEARIDDAAVHTVPVEVVDLALPKARLEMTVLGDLHLPGKQIGASFRARDLRGRPIAGAAVEYRATFGGITLRDTAGRTDADGRTMVRFTLPGEVEGSGHLAAGIAFAGGEAAIARRIPVAAPVASIDAFPEGGSVLEEWPGRMALLVRDGAGDPAGAEGRIVDDTGATVALFKADAAGLATAIVHRETGRTYSAVVDRPAGSTAAFPLPGPTGHDHAIAVEDATDAFDVVVASRRAAKGRLQLLLEAGGVILARNDVRPDRREAGAIRSAHLRVPRAGAQGIGHLILVEGGRAIVKRPVLLGARAPVTVTLEPVSKGPCLPGRAIELELRARHGDKPVSADLAVSIFQGSATGVEDLAARVALEPSLPSGTRIPPRVLEDPGRRDAFVLVHDAYAYGAGGAPLDAGGLPAAEAGRVAPSKPAPSPPARTGPEGRKRKPATAVRQRALERALEAAPYTVLLEKEDKAHEIRLDVPPAALVAPPGGGSTHTLPQMLPHPTGGIDTRRTLFWEGRVRTGPDGRAVIGLRLNHVISDVAWIVQGFAGIHAASGRGTLSPAPSFETKFRAPAHLLAGDAFDLMLEVTDRDRGAGIIEIEVFTPPCLKPLLRTRLSFDAGKDARLQRFRFEAVKPAEEAELRVVARRGLHEETHTRKLRVEEGGVDLAHGEAGFERGLHELSFRVPAEAAPGSVRLHASVFPGPIAEAQDISQAMLRQPVGCFEQFTSANLSNLVLLDALLERGEEPKALERAYRLAEEGFERLLQHRDPTTGGFVMFPGGAAEIAATAVALPQLVLHERVGGGRGRPELETAIRWLERAPLAKSQELYLTFVLHEAGRSWKRSEAASSTAPSSPYERALQAACIACWPGERPEGSGARLEGLLDEIEGGAAFFDPKAAGGEGLLGSRGDLLGSEVLALAIIALDAGGRPGAAERLAIDLRRRGRGSLGTQGGALATRALARVSPAASSQPFRAEFDPGAGAPRRAMVCATRGEPLVFEETVPLGPGDRGRVALEIRSEEPCAYRLAYTYRTEVLRSSPEAPFTLGASMPAAVDLNGELPINVVIVPRKPATSSQVVARIGLPGGVEILDEKLEATATAAKVAHWEVRDGFIDIYWARPPTEPVRLVIAARATVPGSFRGRPSVIGPYYETGRDHYSPALALSVHNPFGIETPFDRPGRLRVR
jgi:hypothetical protein